LTILPYFIMPAIVVLIFSTLMSFVYKNKVKKDKGFVLNYHRLTYRRRLIRALWGIPIIALLYFALYRLSDLTSHEYKIIGVIFLTSVLLDIGYNYVKWKSAEKKKIIM